jgi:hypothetical protein
VGAYEFAVKLRELIIAEVAAGIAGAEEDEAGFKGHNQAECKEADKIFLELLGILGVPMHARGVD